MIDAPRVLMLAPSSGRGGGIERYVGGITDALAQLAIPVRRFALTSAASATKAHKARVCVTAAASAVRSPPTHVFAMHPNLFTFATRLARRCGAEAFGWVYGVEVFTPDKAAAVVERSGGLRLVTISEWTRKCLVAAGASPSLPVVLPALGAHWLTNARTASVTRQEAPTPRIVAITRFDADVEFKGVDTLIALVERFARRNIRIDLDLVGIGDQLARFRALSVDRRVGDRVHFHGWLDDDAMLSLLGRAWLFALPSRLDPEGSAGEGFGIVYVEAASAGVPVIGSTDGGAAEALVDEVTGLAVDPTDIDALEAAVERLCDDKGLRDKLGHEGARWAQDEFTIERMATDMSRLLRLGC